MQLASALKDNSMLTSLDMSLNQLEDSVAEALAFSLLENQTLTELDLDRTALSAEAALLLVQATTRGAAEEESLFSLHLDQSIILDMMLLS